MQLTSFMEIFDTSIQGTVRDIARQVRDGATPQSIVQLAMVAAVIIVIGPIAEAQFWRGMALPILERVRGPVFGFLVTPGLFGIGHLPQWTSFGSASAVRFGATATLFAARSVP